MTGAVGVAGGVLIARTALRRQRKIDLGGVSHHIGNASRQFGRLAGELRNARERTEQIGAAIG